MKNWSKTISIFLVAVVLSSCYRELHIEQSTETINLNSRTTEVEFQPIIYKKSRYEVTLVRKRNRHGDTMYVAENLDISKDSNVIVKNYDRIVNYRGKIVRFDYPIDLLDYMEVRDFHLKDTTHTSRGINYHFKKEYAYRLYKDY